MQHRHLNHQRFTLAAIDDVIRRGRWSDWNAVTAACAHAAVVVFDLVCEQSGSG